MFHIINYSHPLTPAQIDQIAAYLKPYGTFYGDAVTGAADIQVHQVKVQLDLAAPLAAQVKALVERDHAVAGNLFVLPRLTEAAALVVARIATMRQYKRPIAVIRLRQNVGDAVTTFEFAELIEVGAGSDPDNINPVPAPDSVFYTPPAPAEIDRQGQRYTVAKIVRRVRVTGLHDTDTGWTWWKHHAADTLYTDDGREILSSSDIIDMPVRVQGQYNTYTYPVKVVEFDERPMEYTSEESRARAAASLAAYYASADEVWDSDRREYVDRR